MAGLKLKYVGSCHCKQVQFEVLAPRSLDVIECNCSICTKKQSKYFMVPAHDFHLLRGHTILTTYTFGTHQAKHLFCSKCGVQTFYIPRSDAESIAIMPHCLDNPTPLAINTVKFDGQNWEKAIAKYNSNNLKNGKKKLK